MNSSIDEKNSVSQDALCLVHTRNDLIFKYMDGYLLDLPITLMIVVLYVYGQPNYTENQCLISFEAKKRLKTEVANIPIQVTRIKVKPKGQRYV